MSWDYQIKERALKQLKKIDKAAAKRIILYLDERIVGDEDPRRFGKELTCAQSWIQKLRGIDCTLLRKVW